MHYVLFYEYAPDYLERRAAYRNAHLSLAWAAHERGELILGGAFSDNLSSGMLLFRCDSPEVPLQFAAADPYVTNKVVVRHHVRPWMTVVGKDAATPVRSAD